MYSQSLLLCTLLSTHTYTTVGDFDSLNMSPSAPHWLKEVEKEDKKMLTGEIMLHVVYT